MSKIKLNMSDIKTNEEYIERNLFLEHIEDIIKNVKAKNYTQAAKLMIDRGITLVFLSNFTIRLKHLDILKLGDEMIKISKK